MKKVGYGVFGLEVEDEDDFSPFLFSRFRPRPKKMGEEKGFYLLGQMVD